MKWDLFLSHASEDKDFVSPLAQELQRRGLRVWYDTAVLKVGHSLRRSIDEGLQQSRFGVVIISPSFLTKEWPQKELDGLFARETDGVPAILPIWHNISAKEVRNYSLTLADRLAVPSSIGVAGVADSIISAISSESPSENGTFQNKELSPAETIAHLSLEDSRVLRLACEWLRQADRELIRPEDIQSGAEALGIDREALLDSIEILDSDGLVTKAVAGGKRVVHFRVTTQGFSIYARHFIPDYGALRKRVAQIIVDGDLWRSLEIAAAIHKDETLVKFMFRDFESEGYMTLSDEASQHKMVGIINPKLKRLAKTP